MLRFYKGSILFTIVCLALGAWYGWAQTGTLAGTASLLWIVIVLSILEVSLSFDNAVINASVLEDMDEIWQRRFLTWGILFAVFGMRIVFPLAISITLAVDLSSLATYSREPSRLTDVCSGSCGPRSVVRSVRLLVSTTPMPSAVRSGGGSFDSSIPGGEIGEPLRAM